MKRQIIFSLILSTAVLASNLAAAENHKIEKGTKAPETLREGESALAKNLRSKMHYPEVARRMGLQGSVVAELSISQTGEITEVAILEPSNYEVFNESVRSELIGASISSLLSEEEFPKRVKIKFTYTKKAVRIESRGEEISKE